MIYALLQQANTTTQELAAALGLGYVTAYRKLRGQRKFSVEELPKLALFLTSKLGRVITVDELLRVA